MVAVKFKPITSKLSKPLKTILILMLSIISFLEMGGPMKTVNRELIRSLSYFILHLSQPCLIKIISNCHDMHQARSEASLILNTPFPLISSIPILNLEVTVLIKSFGCRGSPQARCNEETGTQTRANAILPPWMIIRPTNE